MHTELDDSLHRYRSFLSRPGPSTGPVQCTIVRETGESRSHPTYKLYLDDPSEFVMAARKRKKSKTSKYVMSVDARVSPCHESGRAE